MAKTIQVKISRQEIDAAVRRFLDKKIADICNKQKVGSQIEFQVDQALIEVVVPEYEIRISALEKAVDSIMFRFSRGENEEV